jgi:hypothetical protein
MTTTAATQTIGTRGLGRWATITADDTDRVITAYDGWLITDEVRLAGMMALTMADSVARKLVSDREAEDRVRTTERRIRWTGKL